METRIYTLMILQNNWMIRQKIEFEPKQSLSENQGELLKRSVQQHISVEFVLELSDIRLK